MTLSQKKYIEYLDSCCARKGLKIRSTDEDMLGADWKDYYKNFTPDYTGDVITKMKVALGIPIVLPMKGRPKK